MVSVAYERDDGPTLAVPDAPDQRRALQAGTDNEPDAPSVGVVVGRVVDEAGRALEDARVVVDILPAGALPGDPDPAALVVRESARTAADGAFRVDLVWTAGALLVRVACDGYVARELRDAVPRTRVELGDVVLSAAAAVCGRVVSELGAAVPDAEVLLLAADGPEGQWSSRLRALATSSASGAFCIEVVPPGLVRLAARARAGSGDWCAPLRLEAGRTRQGVELRLVTGVCLRGTLRGRLPDGTAAAIQGEVSFASTGSYAPLRARSIDGTFEVCGMRAGASYHIVVEAPGYQPLSGINVLTVPADLAEMTPLNLVLDACRSGELWVVDGLSGGAVAGAEAAWSLGLSERIPRTLNGLAVRAARSIGSTDARGHVAVPANPSWSSAVLVRAPGYAPAVAFQSTWSGEGEGRGRVALWRGHRLEVRVRGDVPSGSVELFLFGRPGLAEPVLAGAPVASAPLRAHEPALFENLPSDSYLVVARAPGRASARSDPVTLEGNEGSTSLELEMGRGARLAGTVVGATGRSETRVRALGPLGLELQTRVASDERYSFDYLPAGEWLVWAEEPPLFEIAPRGRTQPPQAIRVRLTEGGRMEQRLVLEPSGSTLQGRLVLNGRPAPGRLVRARSVYLANGEPSPWRKPEETLTDSEGRFRLTDVRGDSLEVSAFSLDGRGDTLVLAQETIARDAAVLSVELHASTGRLTLNTLSDGGEALGWVEVDLAGDPAEGGVLGFEPDARWRASVHGSGRATLELPAGGYVLEADGPGGVSAVGFARVGAEQEASIDLRLSRD